MEVQAISFFVLDSILVEQVQFQISGVLISHLQELLGHFTVNFKYKYPLYFQILIVTVFVKY